MAAADFAIFSWGRRWSQCAKAGEHKIRTFGMLPVDCLQLWKDPALEFPCKSGETSACQAYVLAQSGASTKVLQVMVSLKTSSLAGVYCEGGTHRARAIAETAKSFAVALGYSCNTYHLAKCASLADVQDRHVNAYN